MILEVNVKQEEVKPFIQLGDIVALEYSHGTHYMMVMQTPNINDSNDLFSLRDIDGYHHCGMNDTTLQRIEDYIKIGVHHSYKIYSKDEFKLQLVRIGE